LRQLTPIAFGINFLRRQFLRVFDVRAARRLHENRLAAQFAQFMLFHDRRRHARERREFVHHAPDVFDMTNDRIRTGLKNFRIAPDFVRVFAAQAFGGKLDRR